MKRLLLILLLVAGVGFAVAWKIGVIKEKRNAPTISINAEYSKHGKPVEVFKVKRGDLKFFARFTGEFQKGEVRIWLSKIQWNKVRMGKEVRIHENGNFVRGSVVNISKTPSPLTGLYRVVVASSEKLNPEGGKKVVVDVETKTLENVISVPSAAIKQQGSQSMVWILEDGKAGEVHVVKGEESDLYVEVLSGLKDGDMIIVRGASSLEKGDKVRVIKSEVTGETI